MSLQDYSVIAAGYAAHRRADPAVVARLSAGLQRASRVLEIGCGTGNYLAAIRDAVGCECIGIDPSPDMLARFYARRLAIPAFQESAEHLGRFGEEFDLVYSVDVIHHVADRAAAFREASRVLRRGGRLCIVTDSEWMIRHRQPQSVYFPETIDVELRRYPGIETVRSEMAASGFHDIREDSTEHSYELTDSTAYRDKVFSSLLYIGDEAFRRGLAQMEDDLRRGPLQCTSRYALLWGTKPDLTR